MGGSIINGDLVNTPNTQSQIDDFLEHWEQGMGNYKVWPGLGNHDYANYVNLNRKGSHGVFKAGNEFGAAKQGFNNGVGQLFDYIIRALGRRKANLYAFDFHQSKTQHDIAWAHNTKWLSGSAAYSFIVGHIMFVQLHNHPGFEIEFRNYRPSKAYSDLYDIKASTSFLKTQLSEAARLNKRIALNCHDPLHFTDHYKDSSSSSPLLTTAE